jgi:hypothetical protein
LLAAYVWGLSNRGDTKVTQTELGSVKQIGDAHVADKVPGEAPLVAAVK